MNFSFKKCDNWLLYLILKVGVNFMNSQHLRLKWHFEKLDKYGPCSVRCFPSGMLCYHLAKMTSRGARVCTVVII